MGAAAKREIGDSIDDALDQTIAEAATWLAEQQAEDGHWVFELYADATMPSEYIFLNHYLGEINNDIEHKIARYLRRTQGKDGGWRLFPGGDFDLNATVKVYYALKLVGGDPDAPHMRRARQGVLVRGAAARANVFTRITLALFDQVPWRATPWMRPEAMLAPVGAVPRQQGVLLVADGDGAAVRAGDAEAAGMQSARIGIRELFLVPPEQESRYLRNPTGRMLGKLFLILDHIGRIADPLFPSLLQRLVIARSMAFIKE